MQHGIQHDGGLGQEGEACNAQQAGAEHGLDEVGHGLGLGPALAKRHVQQLTQRLEQVHVQLGHLENEESLGTRVEDVTLVR
jgi:hypothetical protein